MDGKVVAAVSHTPRYGTDSHIVGNYICLMYNQITVCDLRSQARTKLYNYELGNQREVLVTGNNLRCRCAKIISGNQWPLAGYQT
jgi:hypothetical protein